MAKAVTLGSANPPTVTNIGGQQLPLFTSKTAWIEIAQKHSLESVAQFKAPVTDIVTAKYE